MFEPAGFDEEVAMIMCFFESKCQQVLGSLCLDPHCLRRGCDDGAKECPTASSLNDSVGTLAAPDCPGDLVHELLMMRLMWLKRALHHDEID